MGLVFVDLHRVDIGTRALRRTFAEFFATHNILENVIQQGDLRANHTDLLEFALTIMLRVSSGFQQRKKIINWFLKPFSLNGNVEAILNISILTSNPVKLCFVFFSFFVRTLFHGVLTVAVKRFSKTSS